MQLPTVKCSQCNKIKKLTSSLRPLLLVKITVNDKNRNIFPNLVEDVLPNLYTLSTDEVEDHLLLHIAAKVPNHHIIALVKKTPSAS